MTDRVRVSRVELEAKIRSGEIDTVVMAFPDLFGRLTGKRTSGRFFLDSVAEHGTENCDYLLATDLDNNPVPGYRFANADLGYGDMVARADWDTVRITPWVPKTALVLCDVFDVDTGAPVEVAPRQVLRRQADAAHDMGYEPMVGSEIEFYLFRDPYDDAHAKEYRGLRPHSTWVEDYHVVQTTRDEYVIGDIRRGLEAAGVPVEFSKGEAGRGQHEINLAFTTAIEMADRNVLYKSAAKEIAASHGRSVTFMAKYDAAETGSSCHVHSSLWSLDGRPLFDGRDELHGMSELFRHYLAGLLAATSEFSLLWAPTVNSYKRFQSGTWASTSVAWGVDNRTLGYRKVGHGPASRVEFRVPGADANSYLAFAGTIAAGLYGIRNRLELQAPFEGNADDPAAPVPRVPTNLRDAIALWEQSSMARECFGDEVHHHLATMARWETQQFDRAVTDWERIRYFERI